MQKHFQSMSEKFLQVASILEDIAGELRSLGGVTAPLDTPEVPTRHAPVEGAKAVERLLEKTHYSYSDVGVLVGVHGTSVKNWLDGKPIHDKNLIRLRAVCRVHGINIDYLEDSDE